VLVLICAFTSVDLQDWSHTRRVFTMEQEETRVVRDEPSGEVREERRVTTEHDQMNPAASAADSEVVSSFSPARRALEVVYLVFGVFDVLLLIRLLLKLMAANVAVPFTGFVYGVTDVLLLPFRGLFPTWVSGRSVFEPSVVIAILVYALIAWALARLLAIMFSRNVTVASRRTTRRPWGG
jgi:hypothetical protein